MCAQALKTMPSASLAQHKSEYSPHFVPEHCSIVLNFSIRSPRLSASEREKSKVVESFVVAFVSLASHHLSLWLLYLL